MEVLLQCLDMSMLDLILYLVQVLIMAFLIGLPLTYIGLYLLHLIDCINEPDRNDWHMW